MRRTYQFTSSTKDNNAKSDRIDDDDDDDPDLSHDCYCRSDHWPISPALLLRLLFLLLPSWMTLSNRSSSNSSFFSRNFLCPTVYWVISEGGLAYDYVGSPTSRGSPNNTFDFLLLSSCSHLSSIFAMTSFHHYLLPLNSFVLYLLNILVRIFCFSTFFHCSLFNSKKAPFYNYILLSIIPFFRLDRFTAILLASHKNSRVTIVLLQLLWLALLWDDELPFSFSHNTIILSISLFPSYHS